MSTEGGSLEAHLAQGHALAWEGRWEAAAQIFQTVVAANPNDGAAQRALGLAYLKLGQTREGVSALETARSLVAADAGLLERLAEGYAQLGESARAAELFAELARLHEAAGRHAEALRAAEEAHRLNPESGDHRLALARRLRAVGREEEALQLQGAEPQPRAQAPGPGPDQVGQAMSELLDALLEGRHQPGGAESWLALARGLDALLAGRDPEAADTLRQALEQGLDAPALRYMLGMLLLATGSAEAALPHLEAASTDPVYGLSAATTLIRQLGEQGRPEQAAGHALSLLRSLDLSGSEEANRAMLEQRYGALQVGEQQLQHLSRFLQDPNLEERMLELRRRLDRLTARGELTLVEAILLEADSDVLDILDESHRWASLGKLVQAREVCQAGLQRHPDFLPLQRRLAELLYQEGRTEEARQKFHQLARVYRLRKEEMVAQWCELQAQKVSS